MSRRQPLTEDRERVPCYRLGALKVVLLRQGYAELAEGDCNRERTVAVNSTQSGNHFHQHALGRRQVAGQRLHSRSLFE